jgi:phthalate 4,5-cis-dihydrodiol dehydrogenase
MIPEKPWSPLRIGLVGLGEQMMDNLLPALIMQQNVLVVATCDIESHKVEALPPSIRQTARHYTDFKHMLNDADLGLDAVIVAASPQLHFEVSMMAMKNSICPWVEKPPSETTPQLLELISMSRAKGLTTGVGVNYQWAPAIQKLQELLKRETFGRPLRATIYHRADKPKEPIWGLNSTLRSFNLAQTIHSAYLSTTLSGNKIEKIFATCDERPLDNRWLWVFASVKFQNGFIADIVANNSAPHFDHKIEVWTDSGSLLEVTGLSTLSVETPVHVQESNCRTCGPLPTCFMDKRVKTTLFQSPVKAHTRGYFEQFEAFLSAVTSTAPFESDFESLIPTYKILDQIELPESMEWHRHSSPSPASRDTVWNRFTRSLLNNLLFW